MRYLRQSTATVIEVGPFIDDGDGKTLEEALTVASIDVQLMQPLDTATVPPDLVTTGDFASDANWTKGANWTISGGNASHSSSSTEDLEQNQAVTENVAYEVVFKVTTVTAGDVRVKIAGTAGTARSTNATFTETIIAGSGSDPKLEFTPTSDFDGDVDDVVVKQVPIPIVPAASGSTNDMVLTQSNTGTYWLEITANQLGIVGRHKLTAFISGALIVWEEFMVVEEEVFDDMFASGAVGYLKSSTAGRDLDVSSGGEAGIDWANVGSPTTAVDLSGTDIQLADTATAVTNDVGITAGAVDNIWDEDIIAAHTTADTAGRNLRVLDAISDRTNNSNLDALLGVGDTASKDIPEQVWAEGTRVLSANTNLNDPTAATIANSVWDEARSGHATLGTYGDAFIGLITGSAEAGTLSTTEMTTDLTEATNDHFNGRTIVWTSGVLLGQASDVTAYLGSTGKLTYTATTDAPGSGDDFVIY